MEFKRGDTVTHTLVIPKLFYLQTELFGNIEQLKNRLKGGFLLAPFS